MSYGDSDDGQSLPSKVGGWIAFAVSFVLAKFIGAMFFIPLALSGLAFFLLRKLRSDPIYVSAMEGLALGQVGWFIVGAIAMPALWSNVALDIIIVFALILWLLLRLSIWPAVLLIIYEVISLFVNGMALAAADPMSAPFKALLVHILWRVLIIAFGCAYLIFGRGRNYGTRDEEASEAVN